MKRENGRERGVLPGGNSGFEKVTGEISQQQDHYSRRGGMGHGFHNCRAHKTPS